MTASDQADLILVDPRVILGTVAKRQPELDRPEDPALANSSHVSRQPSQGTRNAARPLAATAPDRHARRDRGTRRAPAIFGKPVKAGSGQARHQPRLRPPKIKRDHQRPEKLAAVAVQSVQSDQASP